MSDLGDIFKACRDDMKELRQKFGRDCPGCKRVQPRRTPTIMLPGQKCRVCGFIDCRDPIILKP